MTPTLDVTLDGSNLSIDVLLALARCDDGAIRIADDGRLRMTRSREVVEEMLDSQEPVYGLTTGLGAKVTQKLTSEELVEFSYQTIRGRAHSLGKPLSKWQVRAAMIVRLNTLLLGSAGASPAVADFIVTILNNNIYPVIGNIGSIGASDLCWGATMGLAFIGEGEFSDQSGNRRSAAAMLEQLRMAPLILKPKDGLALANHSSFSAALSAIAISQAASLLNSIQSATALTMEAYRANLSPLDATVQSIAPQSGPVHAADRLRWLLEGSRLFVAGQPRKIQDPLSIRNAVQVHGAAYMALEFAQKIVDCEINSCTDNPIVDIEQKRMISSGAYYSAHLTLAVETVSRALDQVVVTQLARMSKLLSNQHTGLPQFLAQPDANSNGFAPTMKIAEALVAEIRKLLMPVSIWPSVNANGVEDIQSHAPLAAKSLGEAAKYCHQLCAMEMIMASQALELRQAVSDAPARVLSLYHAVRQVVSKLDEDRPMGADIENLAQAIEKHPIGSEVDG